MPENPATKVLALIDNRFDPEKIRGKIVELNKNPYEELLALDAEILRVVTELTQLEREAEVLKDRRERLIKATRTLEDQGFITNPNSVIKFADPELERLLAEEEHIEATVLGKHDVTTCPYCIGGIE